MNTFRTTESGFILLPVVSLIALLAVITYLMNYGSGMGLRALKGNFEEDEAYFVAEAGIHHARWEIFNGAGFVDIPTTILGEGPHSYSVIVSPKTGVFPVTLTVTATLGSGLTRQVIRTFGTAVVADACNQDGKLVDNADSFSISAFGGTQVRGFTYLPPWATFNGEEAPSDGAILLSNRTANTLYMIKTEGDLITSLVISEDIDALTFVYGGEYANHIAGYNSGTDKVVFLTMNGTKVHSFSMASFGDADNITFIYTTETGLYQNTIAIEDKGNDVIKFVSQQGATMGSVNFVDAGVPDILGGMAHIHNTNKLLVVTDAAMAYKINFAEDLLYNRNVNSLGVANPQYGISINVETCDAIFLDKTGPRIEILKNE